MKTKPWREIRDQKLSVEQRQQIDEEVERELVEMDIRAIRELLGKTQEDVAMLTQMTQSEVSRFEGRRDHRLSTLSRIVGALGGELEVIASFGDKRVRLRAAG